MKKSVKIIAALCLMAALVLTLAACGDSLEGTWKLVDGASADSGIVNATLTLNKDKTFTIIVQQQGGSLQSNSGIWISDDETVTISYNHGGKPIALTREGGKLTLEEYGIKYVFEKK